MFFIFEILFQLLFVFDSRLAKQPLIFYNAYCDQEYWNKATSNILVSKKLIYHPILSLKNKSMNVPNSFDKMVNEKTQYEENNYIFYGSSFVDHRFFREYLLKNNIINKNYAVSSYGLDQIYLSYKLTASHYKNKTIILGFLLEDLDRSIFYKRDYNKVKLVKNKNNFQLTNIPVDLQKTHKKKFDIYTYRLIRNFLNLTQTGFDPRLSQCLMEEKIKIFDFILNDIKNIAKINNQNISVILFNFFNDFNGNPSWRYEFITKYLQKNKIKYFDSLKILENSSTKNSESIRNYYGDDLHYNMKGFTHLLDSFF